MTTDKAPTAEPTERDRQRCSPESPMPPNAPGRWLHTEAEEIIDHGDTRRMQCKTCGQTWIEELPQ